MNFGMPIVARSAAFITSYGVQSSLLILPIITRVGIAGSHGL
jgi:hypothetical protein